jgi:hypothetical protein
VAELSSVKMTTPPIIDYLRSLDAVRERSQQVFDLAVNGQVDHWDWHQDKLDSVVDYCLTIIKVSDWCNSGILHELTRLSATLEQTIQRSVYFYIHSYVQLTQQIPRKLKQG